MSERDDLVQLHIEELLVLVRTNQSNRADLIERNIEDYLRTEHGSERLSLERLRDAIDREEAENLSVGRDARGKRSRIVLAGSASPYRILGPGGAGRSALSDQLLKRLRTWLNSFSVRRATALIARIALLEDVRDLKC